MLGLIRLCTMLLSFLPFVPVMALGIQTDLWEVGPSLSMVLLEVTLLRDTVQWNGEVLAQIRSRIPPVMQCKDKLFYGTLNLHFTWSFWKSPSLRHSPEQWRCFISEPEVRRSIRARSVHPLWGGMQSSQGVILEQDALRGTQVLAALWDQ